MITDTDGNKLTPKQAAKKWFISFMGILDDPIDLGGGYSSLNAGEMTDRDKEKIAVHIDKLRERIERILS